MTKNSINAVAIAAALALGAPLSATAQSADNYWSDYDRGAWESDNWGMDRYGSYDNDFNWNTDDEWYKKESEGSGYDILEYDDAGDGDWFDWWFGV